MNRFIPALAAACFALSAASSFAQTPPAGAAPAPSGEHRHMTPEQRAKMKETYQAARKACEGNANRDQCMNEQLCAKAEDKAKCQARVTEGRKKMGQHMDQRQAIAEACTGKRGDALKQCYREQHDKTHGGKSDKKG